MTQVTRGPYVKANAPLPQWDGERINGRPVCRCAECGCLRYAENIEYIGESALGGPNFSYNYGEEVRTPQDT